MNLHTEWCLVGYRMTLHQLRWFFYHCILNIWLYLMNLMGMHNKWVWPTSCYYPSMTRLRKAEKGLSQYCWCPYWCSKEHLPNACHNHIAWCSMAVTVKECFKFNHDVIFVTLFYGSSIDYVLLLLLFTFMFSVWHDTRWFKYDRDWFVCKQATLRSSCATLREWSHNLHPPSCSG